MRDAQQLRKVSILLNLKNKYEAKIFNRFSQVNFLDNLMKTWERYCMYTVPTYLQTKDEKYKMCW